ncbi:restriction endonuclease [Rhodococcus koreensis]
MTYEYDMTSDGHSWESYEEVAQFLLNKIAAELGLERVEGKQHLVAASGAKFEVDAKGVMDGDEGIVLIECKRYPTRRLDQDLASSLAWKIIDLGAKRGIFVTPLGLQEGARKVADAAKIETIHLDPDSTRVEYVLKFLNKAFVGVMFRAEGTLSAKVEKVEGPGTRPLT